MSKDQDNLDTKLSEAKQNAHKLLSKKKSGSGSAVEIAKTRSPKDLFLWAIIFIALIAATLVNYKLPGIWQPANDIWIRIGIITALIILALICFVITNQGKAFKILLKDAGTELYRVTWPSKRETTQYTWQTLLVIGIVALMVWILDSLFNRVVSSIIGWYS